MRFFFHFEGDGITTLDHDGVDLPDTAAARAEAIATIADTLRDQQVGQLWRGKPLSLWVTDRPGGEGKTLFTLHITATTAEN